MLYEAEHVQARFEAHYVPKLNVTYETHKFFLINEQTVGIKSMKDLCFLAKTCEFGTLS